MKTRPYRIYRRKGQQKRYIRKDGKKTYIKIKNMKKMPDRNLVSVMIKNVVGHRRVPARTTTTKTEGTKPLAYTQGITPKLVHVPLTPFLTDDKEEIKKLKENAKDKTVVVNVENQDKKEHEPKVATAPHKSAGTDMAHGISGDHGDFFTMTRLQDRNADAGDRKERVRNSHGNPTDKEMKDKLKSKRGDDILHRVHDFENHHECNGKIR